MSKGKQLDMSVKLFLEKLNLPKNHKIKFIKLSEDGQMVRVRTFNKESDESIQENK